MPPSWHHQQWTSLLSGPQHSVSFKCFLGSKTGLDFFLLLLWASLGPLLPPPLAGLTSPTLPQVTRHTKVHEGRYTDQLMIHVACSMQTRAQGGARSHRARSSPSGSHVSSSPCPYHTGLSPSASLGEGVFTMSSSEPRRGLDINSSSAWASSSSGSLCRSGAG